MAVNAFLEVRRKLKAASIVISLHDECEMEKITIGYEKSSIYVKILDESNVIKTKFRYFLDPSETFHFKPRCFSGLQNVANRCENDDEYVEMNLIVRAELDIDDECAEVANICSDVNIPVKNMPTSLSCRCGKTFLGDYCFDKVLPLPSSDWQELAAEWYCHKHESDGVVRSNVLSPKSKECLYNDSNFRISYQILENTYKEQDVIHCDRCCSVVGHVKSIDSECFAVIERHLIFINNGEFSDNLTYANIEMPENIILRSVNGSCAINRFLFSPNSSYGTKDLHHLIVWVMDSHLEVLNSKEIFFTHSDVWRKAKETTIKNRSQNDTSTVQFYSLKSQKMMKVLYRYINETDELLKVWSHDSSVHHVDIPIKVLNEMVERFTIISDDLPIVSRKVDEFFVCYLPDNIKELK